MIGNAVRVMRIATGEEAETLEGADKDQAAREMGKKGAAARTAKLTGEKRAEIARIAAEARWKKD